MAGRSGSKRILLLATFESAMGARGVGRDVPSNCSPGANLVILIGKEVPELVAGSFSAFVDLYLSDAPALYESPPLTGPITTMG